MNSDPTSTENRLVRLEQKVNLLLVAAAIQVATILIGWINAIFGSVFWFSMIVIATGGLLYAFREQLPQLSGKLIRYVFSRRQGTRRDTDDDIV